MATTNPLTAFGSKLNQGILTPSDFDRTTFNNPDHTKNFATRIDVIQPLIKVDGLFERQVAKSKMDAYQLETERIKNNKENKTHPIGLDMK